MSWRPVSGRACSLICLDLETRRDARCCIGYTVYGDWAEELLFRWTIFFFCRPVGEAADGTESTYPLSFAFSEPV